MQDISYCVYLWVDTRTKRAFICTSTAASQYRTYEYNHVAEGLKFGRAIDELACDLNWRKYAELFGAAGQWRALENVLREYYASWEQKHGQYFSRHYLIGKQVYWGTVRHFVDRFLIGAWRVNEQATKDWLVTNDYDFRWLMAAAAKSHQYDFVAYLISAGFGRSEGYAYAIRYWPLHKLQEVIGDKIYEMNERRFPRYYRYDLFIAAIKYRRYETIDWLLSLGHQPDPRIFAVELYGGNKMRRFFASRGLDFDRENDPAFGNYRMFFASLPSIRCRPHNCPSFVLGEIMTYQTQAKLSQYIMKRSGIAIGDRNGPPYSGYCQGSAGQNAATTAEFVRDLLIASNGMTLQGDRQRTIMATLVSRLSSFRDSLVPSLWRKRHCIATAKRLILAIEPLLCAHNIIKWTKIETSLVKRMTQTYCCQSIVNLCNNIASRYVH